MNDAGRLLPIPKGDYADGTTYDILDFVYYLGKTYIAKKKTTGKTPPDSPDDWQLMADGNSADKLSVTDTQGFAGTAEETVPLQEMLDGMAEKVKTNTDDVASLKTKVVVTKYEKKIATTEWSGAASQYTCTISIPSLTENQLVYVTNNASVTQDQIDAFADACITGQSQTAGKIVLQAINKPTIELPITILVGSEPNTGSLT